MVTFERCSEEQDILPEYAHGACGWMVALAPDKESARSLLTRDIANQGLRVVEIDGEREVFGEDELDALDDHLALNFRNIERGKQTVWGTIHCYKGEGQA